MHFRFLVVTALLLASSAAPSVAGPASTRIVVKYRTPELAAGSRAYGADAMVRAESASLERLRSRFRVRAQRPLFEQPFDEAGGPRRTHSLASIDAVRERFPERALRAPAGITAPDLANIFVLELADGVDATEAAAAFAAEPAVEYAEPDQRMHASFVPNDTYWGGAGSWGQPFADLWGLHSVNASSAWDISTGTGTIVAVVDTGIKERLPDLAGNLWWNTGEIPRNRIDDDENGYVDDVIGWDFTRDKPRPRDRRGHGTHVAGTIAATGNNDLGVIGVSWGARVMAVQGLDRRGDGWSLDLAKAIVYAVQNGADVINNSWGGLATSPSIRDAVDFARAAGCVVVFAAGNDAGWVFGPAADPDVITVAATAPDDVPASFSNHGPEVSVAAPGVEILSLSGGRRVGGPTVDKLYRVLSGTSMAAPHVSGIAALLLAADPTLSVDEVRWHLELNADQPGYPGYEGAAYNPYLGWGRVNAARAFDAPPVTMRVATKPFRLHEVAGAIAPDARKIRFRFTTHDPVSWSLTSPAWLQPSQSHGVGDTMDGSLTVALDAGNLAVGTHVGSVAVDAPATVEGGATVAATAHVHADRREGAEIVVADRVYPWARSPVRAIGYAGGVFVTWIEYPYEIGEGSQLKGAFLRDDGGMTGPFVIHDGATAPSHRQKIRNTHAVAYDGSSFLVAWADEAEELANGLEMNHLRLNAVRVSAAGVVLDAAPIEIALHLELPDENGFYREEFFDVRAGFDGSGYTVVWSMLEESPSGVGDVTLVFLRRLGTDGMLQTPTRQIYPTDDTELPQYIRTQFACMSGQCLLAWLDADGERSPVDGRYIHKAVGQRFSGDQPIDLVPFRIASNLHSVAGLAASPNGFFVVGTRVVVVPGELALSNRLLGARVSSAGVALDPDPLLIDRATAPGLLNVTIHSTVFDGQSYVTSWSLLDAYQEDLRCYAMATRVAPSGSVLDAEADGLMVRPGVFEECNGEAVIAASESRSYAIWMQRQPGTPRIVAHQFRTLGP